MMKILNQTFKVLSYMVVAVIIFYLAITAPIIMGYRPMVVLSGSMEPTYGVGSIIYYKSCTFEELKEGDPLTFQIGDSLATHRITKVNELSRTLVTKGDNNETEDPVPVEESKIVGRATNFAIPYAGYFVTYGKHPSVIACMAIVLLFNYIFEGIVSRQEDGEKANEKKIA